MGDIRQTEVCRTSCLSDSQIKRQHVNRFAAPGPIQQLRVSQSMPDIRRHRFENRRLLLRLRALRVAVSIVTAIHQFFKEAGRLWHDHALDTLISRNFRELLGDLNRLIQLFFLTYACLRAEFQEGGMPVTAIRVLRLQCPALNAALERIHCLECVAAAQDVYHVSLLGGPAPPPVPPMILTRPEKP